MMRKLIAAAFALAFAAATTGADDLLAQQGQGFGLQVDIGASVLTGDDFDAWDTGVNFDALGSYAWTSGWEAGVAAGFASHDVNGDDTQLNNVSAVLRKRFHVPRTRAPHLHPYLEGRFGWVQNDPDAGDSDSGIELGGGAGLEYWLSQQVGLTGGVNLGYIDIAEASGLRIVPRAGLKVRFGGS